MKVKVAQSVWLLVTPWTIQAVKFSRPGYWSGNSLLQGIFPTQRSNPGLLHCRQILYQLNHRGSSRILEWVAYPFSRGSSWPRNWTRVSCIAGRFFTNWAMREALSFCMYLLCDCYLFPTVSDAPWWQEPHFLHWLLKPQNIAQCRGYGPYWI